MKLMKREPSPNCCSGLWYVIRQNDGYKLEAHYWKENAIEAAEYLTNAETDNTYYVEKRERLDE